jgi:ribosome-associated protein
MIDITNAVAIEKREVEESFVRAAGPGGQDVNKIATAVQLRFDIRRSPSLPDDVRARLEKLAGRRLTQEGVLIITARRYRAQERNRQDALERLVALIRRAAVRPAPRRLTKPAASARRRRLEAKSRRAGIKKLRTNSALRRVGREPAAHASQQGHTRTAPPDPERRNHDSRRLADAPLRADHPQDPHGRAGEPDQIGHPSYTR